MLDLFAILTAPEHNIIKRYTKNYVQQRFVFLVAKNIYDNLLKGRNHVIVRGAEFDPNYHLPVYLGTDHRIYSLSTGVWVTLHPYHEGLIDDAVNLVVKEEYDRLAEQKREEIQLKLDQPESRTVLPWWAEEDNTIEETVWYNTSADFANGPDENAAYFFHTSKEGQVILQEFDNYDHTPEGDAAFAKLMSQTPPVNKGYVKPDHSKWDVALAHGKLYKQPEFSWNFAEELYDPSLLVRTTEESNNQLEKSIQKEEGLKIHVDECIKAFEESVGFKLNEENDTKTYSKGATKTCIDAMIDLREDFSTTKVDPSPVDLYLRIIADRFEMCPHAFKKRIDEQALNCSYSTDQLILIMVWVVYPAHDLLIELDCILKDDRNREEWFEKQLESVLKVIGAASKAGIIAKDVITVLDMNLFDRSNFVKVKHILDVDAIDRVKYGLNTPKR